MKLLHTLEQLRREVHSAMAVLRELVELRREKATMDRLKYEEKRERLWALAYKLVDNHEGVRHALVPRRAPRAFINALNDAHMAGANAGTEYESIDVLWARIID